MKTGLRVRSRKRSRMGYELFVSDVEVNGTDLKLTVENRGVAPFYHDWPIEIRIDMQAPTPVKWRISQVLPGESVEWTLDLRKSPESLRMRVPNPMAGGKPLRFANKNTEGEWLVLK